MKTYIRILALLIVSGMLFSLASCGGGGSEISTQAPALSMTDAVAEEESTDSNYICDLPEDLDYKEAEVNILYAEMDGRLDELVSEELTGSIISDAVYERNQSVEDQLNIRLSFTGAGEDAAAEQKVRNVVQAGDRSFDLFCVGSWVAMPMVISGVYLELNDIENIDLSKHYWVQKFNELVTYTSENRQFLATSAAAMSMYRMTYLTIFNRALMEERKMPDLYEVANTGEWTLDYQYKLIADVFEDDGDGKATEDDFYGFLTGAFVSTDPYLDACKIHLVIRDGDWIYNSDAMGAMTDMMDKVRSIYHADGTFVFSWDDDGAHTGFKAIEKFAEEEALMATTLFFRIERRFDMLADCEYGILPMPKLNVAQQNYWSCPHAQVSAFGISAAIGDEERQSLLGAVMESIAYHSHRFIRPAYFDATLSLRFMQDIQSRDMLDMIVDSISFDYCYFTGIGDVRKNLRTILPNKHAGSFSPIKKWETALLRALEREKDALEKMYG